VLERWTRAVVRWRVAVLAIWALVLVAGALGAAHLSGHLTTSLDVPGSSSARANVILVHDFADNVEGTFTVVVPVTGADTAHVARLEHAIAAAGRAVPGSRVTQERAAFGLLYVNLSTADSLRRAAGETAALRRALVVRGVARALVTGPPALQHDVTPILRGDLRRGEILALVLALVLLVAVLGLCGAVAVPFVVAAATAAGAQGIVYLLALRWVMVLYIPNVIGLIGLGLAIDYALLLVHRFRSEVAVPGASVEDAVVATMTTAGRTVLTSGLAVSIGLASLLVVPVPFLRSLGVAGLCVPVVAMAAALTLQPALLSLLGARGVRPVGPAGLLASRDPLRGLFAIVTRGLLRRPGTVAMVTTLTLLGAASGALWLQVTPASETAIPGQLPAARALALVRTTIGPGVSTPIEVVIDTGRPRGAAAAAQRAARLRLATAVLGDPESFVVAIGAAAPYVDASGRYERIFVVGRHDLGSPATQALVRHIRSDFVARAHFPRGTRVDVGGAPSQGLDFLDAIYGAFGWIVAAALVLAYLVLARAFRSLTLPLVAVLLDLLTVGAAYGLTVAVFRGGPGASLLGTYHVAQLEGWVPVFIFALLFGLSSDYEVFIVARMREARDAGANTRRAILEGAALTGGVVSAAALIMVGAVSGLVLGRVAGLQELGVGVTMGVLVDATLVRGLLLPSVMALLGERCWFFPAGAARALRVAAPAPEGTGPLASSAVT
jgi:putative drug exporter of the RND superfamily